MTKKTIVVFTVAAVAVKYTTDWPTDPIVHVCGIYKGPLSSIPIEAADALVKQGSNLLVEKPAAPKGVTKPNETTAIQAP